MGLSTGMVGGLAVTALTEAAGAGAALAATRPGGGHDDLGDLAAYLDDGDHGAPFTPPEDLMRDHGVLKRVMLIYNEGARWILRGQRVPRPELHAAAEIIRHYVEAFHEGLEETHLFPKLDRVLHKTITTLYIQHGKGRVLTDHILAATTSGHDSHSKEERRRLVDYLEMFVRMYEVHEAREDTVVFPTFRRITPPRTFIELGDRFHEEGERRFAKQGGFAGLVDMCAQIEKRLDIYDLAKFTAPVKDNRPGKAKKHASGRHQR
jgi:hemerythrin-like domain-containing protein